MRTPPRLATGVLQRLGHPDDAFIGDLAEAFRAGRSRTWYWRQVLSSVALIFIHDAAQAPVRTLGAATTGWLTALTLFLVLGDATRDVLSQWLFGWNWLDAVATQLWWPLPIVAVLVSYIGFALSGCAVATIHRRHAGSALIAYTVSVPLVLAISAAAVDVLTRRHGHVSGPHALFYTVSVALPDQWRSGLLLAPAVTLVAGLFACPRRSAFEHLRPEI
jgi:hypothetical protein